MERVDFSSPMVTDFTKNETAHQIITSTKDYDKFSFDEANRPVMPIHVYNLKKSMQKQNLLHISPIIVDPNFTIIDGQHRFTAAKELGLDVFYVVAEDKEITKTLNVNSKRWCLLDYVRWHAKNKTNRDYVFLYNMVENHNKYDSLFIMNVIIGGGTSYNNAKNGKLRLSHTKPEIESAVKFSIKLRDVLMQHPNKHHKASLNGRKAGLGAAAIYRLIKKHPTLNEEAFLNRVADRSAFMQRFYSQSEFVEAVLMLYNIHLSGRNKIKYKESYEASTEG